jgi:hypothetical protein
MKSIQEFKTEAVQYQQLTKVSEGIKDLVLESFVDVMDFEEEEYNVFWKSRDALQDLVYSVVYENYKSVIYSVDVTEDMESLIITLNFILDSCTRTFKLSETCFKFYKESLEEESD